MNCNLASFYKLEFIKNDFPSEILKPQIVFITGDLAYSGREDDYFGCSPMDEGCPPVIEFLIKLGKILGMDDDEIPKRIFPVPGNHDVFRDFLGDKLIENANLHRINNREEIASLLLAKKKKKTRDFILGRLSNYAEFFRKLRNVPKASLEDILWYSDELIINDSIRIGVVGLCSSWLSGSHWKAMLEGTSHCNDEESSSYLALCDSKILTEINKVRGVDILILLMHHNYETLSEEEKESVRDAIENNSDFVLCGHVHKNRLWPRPLGSRMHIIQTGSLYYNRGYHNAFNIVEVDLEKKMRKMIVVEYNKDRWVIDRNPVTLSPIDIALGYRFDIKSGVFSFPPYRNKYKGLYEKYDDFMGSKEELFLKKIISKVGEPRRMGFDIRGNLISISFSDCMITELPSEIGNLNHLKELDLSNNCITQLPQNIENLIYLQELDLSNNRLTHLPHNIGNLTNLLKLVLTKNQINILPFSIGDITTLQFLDVSWNHLTQIPNEIANLTKLQFLHLSWNRLSKIPANIGNLTNLQFMTLSGNNFTKLPIEITKLINVQELTCDIHLNLAVDTLKKRDNKLLDFFDSSVENKIDRYITKLHIVGEAGVGKSSILRCLLGKDFVDKLESTHGIEVQRYQLSHPILEDADINFNIWDYGGQPEYYTTHQFFFTKQSIYLLVWNAELRMEQGNLYYWLETIRSFAPNSPIIIVATHIDENEPAITYQTFLSQFPQLCANLKLSNKTREGLDKLKETIAQVATGLRNIGLLWPREWISVEEKLQKMDVAYIDYEQYTNICQNEGIFEDGAIEILADRLHHLGVILHIHVESKPSNILILKANWITKAICSALKNVIVKENLGLLDHRELPKIWADYPPFLHSSFFYLMEYFDLSYRIPSKEGFSLIPLLLPSELQSRETLIETFAQSGPCIEMIFDLNFVPEGIMSKFIVRTNNYSIEPPKHWYNGVFLHYNGHYALVELSKYSKELTLKVWGVFPHNFFLILMHVIVVIFKQFPGLKVNRRIPCICQDSDEKKEPCGEFFLYDDLVRRFEGNILHIKCPITLQEIQIKTLLYGIHPYTRDQICRDLQLDIKEKPKLLKGKSDKFKAMVELVQWDFCRTYNLLIEKRFQSPNIFLLKHNNDRDWDIQDQFTGTFYLQLLCQSPHGWHPTLWEKEIIKPIEWWFELSPWLDRLIEILKVTFPLGCTMESGVSRDTQGSYEKNLNVIVQFTKRLANRISENQDEKHISTYPTNNKSIELALMNLYRLLDELDPIHDWGGLYRIQTLGGSVFWLCPKHKKEYLSSGLKI